MDKNLIDQRMRLMLIKKYQPYRPLVATSLLDFNDRRTSSINNKEDRMSVIESEQEQFFKNNSWSYIRQDGKRDFEKYGIDIDKDPLTMFSDDIIWLPGDIYVNRK